MHFLGTFVLRLAGRIRVFDSAYKLHHLLAD